MDCYAIIAYDGIYEGSYGLKSYKIMKDVTEEEATIEATELSYNLIMENNWIMDDIEEEVFNECNLKGIHYDVEDFDVVADIRDKLIEDDIEYEIIKLDEDKIKNFTMKDLLAALKEDEDQFIKFYGTK